MMGFTLLPCVKDVCQECATKHTPEQPHNAQSMYYQYKFYGREGKWPSWADAVAHCPEPIKQVAIKKLRELGVWKGEWETPISKVPEVMPNEDHTIGRMSVIPIKPEKSKKSKKIHITDKPKRKISQEQFGKALDAGKKMTSSEVIGLKKICLYCKQLVSIKDGKLIGHNMPSPISRAQCPNSNQSIKV